MSDFKKSLIKILVISLIFILALSGLFYFFYTKIVKRVAQIENYKKELVQRGDILNTIYELEKEESLSLVYLNQLQKTLPTESEMVIFEKVLQNLANQNNLNLSFRFGLLNEAKDSEPKSYSFNLILSGTKISILKWLTEFKDLAYRTRLEQIELTQTQSGGEASYYDIKILGRVYIR